MGKYSFYLMTTFKNTQVYKLDLVIRIASSFLMVIALREVWMAIYHSGEGLESATGVSLQEMVTYAVIAVIMSSLLAPSIAWEIGARVREGNIILDLQKPWNFQWMHLSRALGGSLFGLVYVVVPMLVATLLFFPIRFPLGLQAAACLLSLAFAILLSFAINFLVGLLAFTFTEAWGIDFLKGVIVDICSGALIPLWLFPQSIAGVLHWLPFQGIYNIPLSLFIGKITGVDVGYSLAFQAGWCIVLLLLCQIGLKRMERMLITSGG